MPARLIRDDMLDSESILSLPVEARWFYVTILLSADDVGLFEANPFKLGRRADIRRESAEAYLLMMVDADLIRLYEADGKRFGFIPRFRQRLQIKRMRYPAPPEALISDDADALNKINNLATKTTDGQSLDSRYIPPAQPPEPEPEPELSSSLRSEDAKRKTPKGTRLSTDWHPSEIDIGFCRTERPDLDPTAVANEFRDYWIGVAGAKGVKADWPATWRNWVRKQHAPRTVNKPLADRRLETMNQLTRGMSTPKPAPFWSRPPEATQEIENDQTKRLL